MLQTQRTPRSEPIRTVMHIAPAVTAVALRAAQRQNLSLNTWLENLVVQSCDVEEVRQDDERLSDLLAVQLFAHVASHSPGLLVGPWRLLFDRCLLDDSLWQYPDTTLDEAERGEDCQPVLDPELLRKRWPALIAASMLVA